MGENTNQLQMTLTALLNTFGAMELKMEDLSKQIVSTQEIVDDIRHRQAELQGGTNTAPASIVVTQEPGTSSSNRGQVLLANDKPPLLETPDEPPAGTGFVTAPGSPLEQPDPVRARADLPRAPDRDYQPERRRDFIPERDHDRDHFVKSPKHDFPQFAGENLRLWVDLALTYFDMYQVPLHRWVSTATLYLDGHAALWWQAFKRHRRLWPWDDFAREIQLEFGQEEYETHMSSLLHLKQNDTVAEYRVAFEAAMYHLIALDPSLNSKFFISQFVFGLKDEIRATARLQAPTSVTRTMALARIQEEELEIHRPRVRPLSTHRAGMAPATAGVAPVQRRNTDDFARERQLRDFRRTNGLCFHCGDKYSKEHQCKKPMQLLTIQVGAHGEVLTEDAVQALELLTEPDEVECCQLSSNAVLGADAVETIQLRALVGNQVMLTLVDSGSSHSFIDADFAQRAALPLLPAPAVQVTVANGQKMQSSNFVQELNWWAQGSSFATTMRVCNILKFRV